MDEIVAMSGEQIQSKVFAHLDQYKGRSALELYAILMGKAQILEFGLKGVLLRKFDVPLEHTKCWTLGKTKWELKNRGVRQDFIQCLESVVNRRNNMAHEFLVNIAITRSIANFSDQILYGDLFRALYEVEQIIILYDWCEENDSWLPIA